MPALDRSAAGVSEAGCVGELAAAASGAGDAELLAVLTVCETAARALDRLIVARSRS